MNTALEHSTKYIQDCERQIYQLEGSYFSAPMNVREEIADSAKKMASRSLGDVAYQRKLEIEHREQLELLHRQIKVLEERLLESNLQKKKLKDELDDRIKACDVYERKQKELVKENKKLKDQIESLISQQTPESPKSNRNAFSSSTSRSTSKLAPAVELRRNRQVITEYENKIKYMHSLQEEQASRIKLLEDALEYQAKESGISGQAELMSKLAALRGEVAALQSEISNKSFSLSQSELLKHEIIEDKEKLQQKVVKPI
jgi:ABC-type phosphate transport system auxiliary subunit